MWAPYWTGRAAPSRPGSGPTCAAPGRCIPMRRCRTPTLMAGMRHDCRPHRRASAFLASGPGRLRLADVGLRADLPRFRSRRPAPSARCLGHGWNDPGAGRAHGGRNGVHADPGHEECESILGIVGWVDLAAPKAATVINGWPAMVELVGLRRCSSTTSPIPTGCCATTWRAGSMRWRLRGCGSTRW